LNLGPPLAKKTLRAVKATAVTACDLPGAVCFGIGHSQALFFTMTAQDTAMGISFDKALGLTETALTLRSTRASVLASNLANVDTPNYKARDIDFQQALKAARSGSTHRLSATRERHFGLPANHLASADFHYRVPTQPSIDGNTVEENTEHAEYMKNSMEFQATFTFLNGSIKGLRKAIRGE
jgi:flagellar basal-body rod protein FlgB